MGFTRFDDQGYPLEQFVRSPPKRNLIALCQSGDYPFVELDTQRAEGGIEKVLNRLLPNYLYLKDDLNLNEAIWFYWLSNELPIGANLPTLATGVETLASSWLKSNKSKSKGVYLPKDEFDELVKDELETIDKKLGGVEYSDRIMRRLSSAYSMGGNEQLRFFFDEIGLALSEAEWEAIRQRNFMAHGASSIFDGSANEKMRRATYTYQTLFNRVLLKVLGYDGMYTDYGTIDLPLRHIDVPSGS